MRTIIGFKIGGKLIGKLIIYLVKKTNPCLNCLVQPACIIPQGRWNEDRKCEKYKKYCERYSKWQDNATDIFDCSLDLICFISFLYACVTFVMGVMYQWKLLFG